MDLRTQLEATEASIDISFQRNECPTPPNQSIFAELEYVAQHSIQSPGPYAGEILRDFMHDFASTPKRGKPFGAWKDTGVQTEEISTSSDDFVQDVNHLTSLVSNYFVRLQRSSTITLNRRLRKVFEICDLTRLSNAVLDNTIQDLDCLPQRFEEGNKSLQLLVRCIQSVLIEMAQLRKMVNSITESYVQKLEEFSQAEASKLLSEEQRVEIDSPLQRCGLSDRWNKMKHPLSFVWKGKR